MRQRKRFVIVSVLLIFTASFIYLHSDLKVPLNKPFTEFPVNYQQWHMVSQPLISADALEVLKPTAYLSREYICDMGVPVNMYIGYHGGGRAGGGIHSPKNCMLGSGWREEPEKQIEINVSGGKLSVNKAVYQNGSMKQLLLYWYIVKGMPITSEYSRKAYEIMNSALYRRTDAAFIRISMTYEGDERPALASGIKFINDFYPLITEYLPK
jgi:EpsI family protein